MAESRRSEFDGLYYKSIWNRKEFIPIWGEHEVKETNAGNDPERIYVENKFGFRSKPFVENEAKLVVSGCSFTYGVGIPQEGRWGDIVSEKLNMPTATLARPGIGILDIVNNLYIYFKKYGNPEVLLCLFPDPYRLLIPIDEKHLTSNYYGPVSGTYAYSIDNPEAGKIQGSPYLATVHASNSDASKDMPKFHKLPIPAEYVISKDIALFYNLSALSTLEQYCNSVGIKFLWSTWERSFIDKLREFQAYDESIAFENYFDIEAAGVVSRRFEDNRDRMYENIEKLDDCILELHDQNLCQCHLDCHSELAQKYGEDFYIGSDQPNERANAHKGVHYNIHVAEAFLSRL